VQEVSPLPSSGAVFTDPRDPARTLRLSWHKDWAVFVLSLWRNDSCLGSFQLPAGAAAEFVYEFTKALAGSQQLRDEGVAESA
jgi:hypothetical protein